MTSALADVNADAILADGIRSLGLSLSRDAGAKLRDYAALLVKWNRVYNLTAIREPARIVTHHLLDALALLPHLPALERAQVLDVVAARSEQMTPEPLFDIVVSRAFADLATFARASANHLAPNGRWYAMKGTLPGDEIAALPATIEVVATIPLHVPGLAGERHLVVMRPRRPSA